VTALVLPAMNLAFLFLFFYGAFSAKNGVVFNLEVSLIGRK